MSAEAAIPAKLRWRDVRERLGGERLWPLGTLFGVLAIDQFDIAAFGLLSPEIVASFHASATVVGVIYAPQLVLSLFLPFIFGYIGDHARRTHVVTICVALWAVCSFATGLSPSIALLLVFRLISGVSTGTAVVNSSLLADYYPTRVRGFAYAIYGAGSSIGTGIGTLVAGALAQAFSWRAAFIVLALPSLVVLLGSLRLREPVRGRWEALEAGALSYTPQENKLGPIRAARVLLKTPTVKRLCWATAVLFAGTVSAGVAGSFYYSAVFGVGPFLRGVFTTIALPVAVVVGLVAGGLGQRWLAEGNATRVVDLAAACFVAGAGSLTLLAFAPDVGVAVLATVAATAAAALAAVPLSLLIAAVVPGYLRSEGFGLFGFFQFALTPITLVLSLDLGTHDGYRVAVLSAAPLYALGGAIAWTARRCAGRDRQRALDVTLAETRAKERREAGETPPLLDVHNLSAGYGSVQVLFGVNFSVAPGETVALLGTNGAGKSTLVRVIAGLLAPSSGAVFLDGQDVTGLDAEVLAERGIVMVPGGRGVFPGLSVSRNLDLGCYLHWREPGYLEQARREAIERFPRLGERLRQPAGTLSGGEQQMLTLAQALMNRPRVLLIDELSLGLAPVVIAELMAALRDIQSSELGIVIIEQSLNIALQLASRAYFLEKGEVRYEGSTAELATRTDIVRSIFLEGAASAAAHAR